MKHFATIFASARLSARARQIMIDKAAASAQITAVYYSKDLGVGVEGGGMPRGECIDQGALLLMCTLLS